MFLMFRLGRPDVLPLDDYSLRKAYAKAFGKRKLPTPEALASTARMAAVPHGRELVSVANPGAKVMALDDYYACASGWR